MTPATRPNGGAAVPPPPSWVDGPPASGAPLNPAQSRSIPTAPAVLPAPSPAAAAAGPEAPRFTARVLIGGLDCLLTVPAWAAPEDLGRLVGLAEALAALGAAPAPSGPGPFASGAGARLPEPGAPSCPAHGTPMRQGRKGWFCPRRVAEDDGTGRPAYCKASAPAAPSGAL